ncbi:MFS transporter [Klebsiella michiganensis]|nr:MFS transporter [Klebsiella michiganensis]
MSNTLLESVVKKNRARLIPFMLALYVLAFLDRSNIGFAKETYQLDTGLSNEAYALGAGIFFVVYAFLGVPANLLMRKFGARKWIGCTTLLWGLLSAAMAWADTEAKFLLVRTLLGAAEAGFFPGMIYLTSQWFPQQNRASIMGLFYMGAPLALTLGSPLSGALLDVFPVEPLPQEDPLWQHPQVVITPHMASIAQTEVIARQLLDNIQRQRQALPLKNLVNKQSGY